MNVSLKKPLALAGIAALTLAGSGAAGALADSGSGSSGQGNVTIQNKGLDLANETVKLPLQRGTSNGQTVWYVVTDDSDANDAKARGVDVSPKLRNALGTKAVQNARLVGGQIDFPGTVDFSPDRVITPGPDGFPPAQAVPGAVGDANYSPLVTTGNGIVLNATQVANTSGLHDSVVAIDYQARTVTLKTFFGFWNGHRTVYLHQDASSTVVAAAEGSTYAPNLDAAPGLGSNDENTSARSAIIPIVNGQRGVTNPQRQGLNSALFGEGDPLNINEEVPGSSNRYSPVWDVTPVIWNQSAIDAGLRVRLTSAGEVRNAYAKGLIHGADGPPNASLDGFPSGGFISNCPIVTTL
ncbi:hypothetical protein NBH00_22045 [Paraconexibacter antarcticus]|uniref:Uncharacterized protein n=1 Tax=Paraconexibacter antarcticus TaxID=2949664 RepID=A0ABY5DPP9_9ACTN|nr:hypothetical protein [Paraconexibacter antarcticus]UTI64008.1 hypothetical protein NBH00_22045 [Paraconexibacter antarcticus]